MTTQAQWNQLLAIVRVVHPHHFNSGPDVEAAAWTHLCGDLDLESATMAVHAWLQTEAGSPTPADVRRLAATQAGLIPPTPDQAWAAIQSGAYVAGLCATLDHTVRLLGGVAHLAADPRRQYGFRATYTADRDAFVHAVLTADGLVPPVELTVEAGPVGARCGICGGVPHDDGAVGCPDLVGGS